MFGRCECYHASVLIDAHTHIFPPETMERRQSLCERDSTFDALYGDPRSKIATADELVAALDRNNADHAIALGFAWADLELCRWQNDTLLRACEQSKGRIVPFCTVNPGAERSRVVREVERCVAAGARGIGELRPASLGIDLDGAAGDLLAGCAADYNLVLSFHTSEPVGHHYPGKTGGELASIYRFIAAHGDVKVIAAHWGGGLPFYALMPEVRATLRNTWFDTAATTLLYDPAIYHAVIDIVGSERILFGSDFPLLGQRRQMRVTHDGLVDDVERALILGDNAAALLNLSRQGTV